MIALNMIYVNTSAVSSASTGLDYLTTSEMLTNPMKNIKIYPFTIEGYVGTLNIVSNTLRSFSIFSQKASERLDKINRQELVDNMNKQNWIEENDIVLFNVMTGELIGSVKTNKLHTLNWRTDLPTFRDAVYDEYLVNVDSRFYRTSHQFGSQLCLKARIEQEIFEAEGMSEYMLGLFLEIEEFKLADYVKVLEVMKLLKPGRKNFDLYEKAYSKSINELAL